MTGATAIAISSSANAQASAALSKAKDAACRAEMPGFEHNTATVQEMQGYAHCVNRLHPEDTGLTHSIAWVVLICMILGVVITGVIRWKSWGRKSWSSWDTLDFAMVYVMSTLGLIAAAFVVSGLAALFTHL